MFSHSMLLAYSSSFMRATFLEKLSLLVEILKRKQFWKFHNHKKFGLDIHTYKNTYIH